MPQGFPIKICRQKLVVFYKLPPTLVGGLFEISSAALAEQENLSIILIALAQIGREARAEFYFLQKFG